MRYKEGGDIVAPFLFPLHMKTRLASDGNGIASRPKPYRTVPYEPFYFEASPDVSPSSTVS